MFLVTVFLFNVWGNGAWCKFDIGSSYICKFCTFWGGLFKYACFTCMLRRVKLSEGDSCPVTRG